MERKELVKVAVKQSQQCIYKGKVNKRITLGHALLQSHVREDKLQETKVTKQEFHVILHSVQVGMCIPHEFV